MNIPTTVTEHDNASAYTLATVHGDDNDHTDDDHAPLLSPTTPSYGTTIFHPLPQHRLSSRRIVFNATLKMALVFLISTLFLGGTLWLALPTLEPADKPLLRIPKSFVQLQQLNTLLKKYRDVYPYRIVICYVTTYLFLQAFSLPGSMYLSILGGAVWGVPIALPLACTCVASGATLCYLISAALGPALLTLPSISRRLTLWTASISSHHSSLISFLIVLRIAPLPPHWVVNVICPHVGIGLVPFFISTWLGILGVTVIHTTIGGGLDEMTSAADFRLISWKNALGLGAVVVGVMIPVGLRYWFNRELVDVAGVEQADAEAAVRDDEEINRMRMEEGDGDSDQVLAVGPRSLSNKQKGRLVDVDDDDDDDFFDDDEDEDIILEAGPAIASKQLKDDTETSVITVL